MKPGSTLILKAAVVFIGLIVLVLCVYIVPVGISMEGEGSAGYIPVVWGLYGTAIPFFIALYQGLKLLRYIDKNQAFSNLSVKALKHIKYCALIICGSYTLGMPYIFLVADQDDAPGVLLIGLIFALASMVIAVFAGVLQSLLQSAIAIKSENDLTV